MTPRRPLPDSQEMESRRFNERLLRWFMAAMGLILLGLVGLGLWLWVLQP